MKIIFIILFLIQLGVNLFAQTPGINYIQTEAILKENVKTEQQLSGLDAFGKQVVYQYIDGLGRSMQQVIVKGSPNQKDIVQPIEYDAFGRQAKEYLPYVSITQDGSFKTDYQAAQAFFYNQANDKITDDLNPYKINQFEPSPLNQLEKTTGPGKTWHESSKGI